MIGSKKMKTSMDSPFEFCCEEEEIATAGGVQCLRRAIIFFFLMDNTRICLPAYGNEPIERLKIIIDKELNP